MLTDFAIPKAALCRWEKLRAASCSQRWSEGTLLRCDGCLTTRYSTNLHSNVAQLRNMLEIMFKFQKIWIQKWVFVPWFCQGREPRTFLNFPQKLLTYLLSFTYNMNRYRKNQSIVKTGKVIFYFCFHVTYKEWPKHCRLIQFYPGEFLYSLLCFSDSIQHLCF